MMRSVSNILQSRTQQTAKLLFRKTIDLQNALLLCGQASFSTSVRHDKARFSASVQHTPFDDQVHAEYVIFKAKAALSVSPLLPTFAKSGLGLGPFIRIYRRGSVMLQFVPAVGEHKYDWKKKLVFCLTAVEIGSLLCLGPNDSREFFHDHPMKSSNAGQVRKTLLIKPYADATGYVVSLIVFNKILKSTEKVTVPVVQAEFAVMRAGFSFVLPHILGWGHYISRQSGSTGENQSKAQSKAEPEDAYSDWER